MATAYDTANIIIPKSAGYKSGSLYGWNPTANSLVDFAVTRAGGTATRVNESGLIESVSANVPRMDWAEGGSCPSLLVEPQRTNIFTYSDPTTANLASSVGITNAANDWGIGLTNKLIFPEIASTQVAYSATAEINTQYALEVYIRFPNGESVSSSNFGQGAGKYGYFNLGGTAVVGGYTVSPVPNVSNLYKVSVIVTTAGTLSNVNSTGFLRTSSNDDALIEVSGFNFQKGATAINAAYPTSYIPTAGTTETRNTDVIQKTGIGSLINQASGTLVIEALSFQANTAFSLSDGTNSNRATLLFDDDTRLIFTVGGVTQADISNSFGEFNVYSKRGFSYGVNNFILSAGGATLGTDTSGITFTGTTLNRVVFTLGDGINFPFFGRIRSLTYIPINTSESEINELTTP